MTLTQGDVTPPRLAATVMLLREAAGGVETLLVRRHAGMAFMGGLWVFPGGKLDPADMTPAALTLVPPPARTRCVEWGARPGRPCSPEEAAGLYLAACRETFEEAGVLLARSSDGTPCSALEVERLQRERDEVAGRPAAFVEMLAREQLEVDGELIPWAHWVTPSLQRIRFDARFFAAAVPADQRVALGASESTEHVWIAPAAAVEACRRGDMLMAGPTIVTIDEAAESIAAHGTVAAVLAAESSRAIHPIIPKLRKEEGVIIAFLPWDPEYDAIPGEGSGPWTEIPERLRRLPSRMPLPAVERRIVR
jgi:8-oxo-dGTP pyrophosphatase MutT (NUDIX family)